MKLISSINVFTPLLTCLHSISLVFHSQRVFTRSQVPVQFFKEPPINPSRIQHQSERCNGSKLNSGGQGKKYLRQNQGKQNPKRRESNQALIPDDEGSSRIWGGIHLERKWV